MKQLLAVAAILAACGGDPQPAATPDAPPDTPEVAAFEPGCEDREQSQFTSAADFGAFTPGTLAGWELDGRWFMTEARVGGASSVHLARSGGQVIVDRDPETPATFDDDALFHRVVFESPETTFIVAKRVVDRLPDGSLRFDRAVCDGASCRVCSAKLVRAEWVEGESEQQNLPLVGELFGADWEPGYSLNVRVVGTLAYLIRFDGLRIIETADPANPVELGHFRRNGDGYSNDLKIVDTSDGRRYAIIADTPVDVVDVTNPAAPVLAAQITEGAHTVFTETRGGQTLAYFGNYDASCPVWDVTDPAVPKRLGRFRSEGEFVHDLSVADGIAYLNAWNAGLLVVDFTTPNAPVLRGQWADTPTDTSHSNWTTRIGGRHLAVHGEESYGAHLDVVDLDADSPTFMQPIGTYKTRDHVSIHNIMAFGTKTYFTHYQDGVRVLDLSDPTQPRLVGYHNTWDPQADYTTSSFFEGAVGLDVDQARGLIFVADGRGLLILRDETP
jgi:hypothetical protein